HLEVFTFGLVGCAGERDLRCQQQTSGARQDFRRHLAPPSRGAAIVPGAALEPSQTAGAKQVPAASLNLLSISANVAAGVVLWGEHLVRGRRMPRPVRR